MTESATEVDRPKNKRGHWGVVSHLINEANLILEGERNDKTITHLKMISEKLKEKLHLLKWFDEKPVVTDRSRRYNRG